MLSLKIEEVSVSFEEISREVSVIIPILYIHPHTLVEQILIIKLQNISFTFRKWLPILLNSTPSFCSSVLPSSFSSQGVRKYNHCTLI